MAFPQEFPGVAVGARSAQAWRLPVGLVSPLWAVFGAAAGAGVAYWWMTQWTRAVNVEALAASPPPVAAPVEIVAEPVAEAASSVILGAPVAEDTAPTAAPESEAAAQPAAARVADDLTRMVGIGPKLSAALAERGVTGFADIAAWTPVDLAEVDAALGLKGRAVREAWVAQARRLAADA